MYKAIFIDIDGTLKDSNGDISDIVISEIEKYRAWGYRLFYVQEEVKKIL